MAPMTWGTGYGLAQGGAPLIVPENPASEVGDPPITFDFSDEPDGLWPFPNWEFLSVQSDGGVVSGEAEPTPDQYFNVRNGFGWWRYRRAPLVGDPFDQRGYLACPAGIVTSDNVEVVVVFRSPTDALDEQQTQLLAEYMIALRSDDDVSDYVGGRVTAEWSAGDWVNPITVEAIQAAGAAPTVLSTAAARDLPDETDTWRAGNVLAELRVRMVDTELVVSVNGVVQTSATVPRTGLRKVGIFARMERVDGSGNRETVPSVASVSVRSLRDLDNLGPPAQLPGSQHLETTQIESNMFLPLREWLELRYITRVEARGFRFLTDVDADVLGRVYRFNTGDIVRAVEPYQGQELTNAVLDLHAKRVEGGNG